MNIRYVATVLAAASIATLAACEKTSDARSEQPVPAPAPAAKVGTGTPTEAASGPGASLAAAAGQYKVDSSHTQVVFQVEHLGASRQYGMFTRVDGNFAIDARNLGNSEIELTIPTASVFTANQKRDDHLRNPDFFDAKQFPNITFKSKTVEATGEGSYRVVGDLTMHGVTKDLTLELEHVGSGEDPEMMGGAFRTGFNGKAVLKRSDWDMNYMQGAGLGDEITLLLAVEGTREPKK